MSYNIYETVGGELNFYFRAVLRRDYGCHVLKRFRREAGFSAALISVHLTLTYI